MEETNSAAEANEERVVLVGQEDRTSSKSDFVSSLLFILVGALTIVESLRMPAFESWGSYARPGFPPMFFGLILILFSGIIFVRSVREGGFRLNLTGKGAGDFLRRPTTIRFIVTLASVAVYFALMRPLTFLISSILYLFFAMMYFKGGSWLRCLIIAVVVGFSTWYLFKRIFLVPLP